MSRELQAAQETKLLRQAQRVKLRFEYKIFEFAEDRPMLTSVRVKLPEYEGGEFMFVIKGVHQGKSVVAFHQTTDVLGGFDACLAKWEANKLKWRDDNWELPLG